MSILTSVGQGDRYFEEKLKKYGLNPNKIVRGENGSLNYLGSVSWGKIPIGEEIPIKFDYVAGNFDCSYCFSLKSLKNSPTIVGGDFDCRYCVNLESLEGIPKKVARNFYCCGCKGKFTQTDIRKNTVVDGMVDNTV